MGEASVVTLWGGEAGQRTPYLTRVVLGPLRLHVFHRGDADPDCHDHPADFWTFPLVSYVEEFVEYRQIDGELTGLRRSQRVVKAFRLHHRRAEFAHRVLYPVSASVEQIATIVLWGRKRRSWGFHTAQGWVPWRVYLNEPEPDQ